MAPPLRTPIDRVLTSTRPATRGVFDVQLRPRVIELHPGGHGWHVNLFVGARLRHDVVAGLWGHGFVWVKDWATDSRVKEHELSVMGAIRLSALYGCKYAAKDWSEEVLAGGAHRYEVAQGFQPAKLSERYASHADAMRAVIECFGRPPDRTSWSGDKPDWEGPVTMTLTWDTWATNGGGDDG